MEKITTVKGRTNLIYEDAKEPHKMSQYAAPAAITSEN